MRESLLKRRVKAANLPSAFAFMGNRVLSYDTRQQTYIDKGYSYNDLVYSAIRLITDKCRIAPFGIYTVEDEQAYKQLSVLMKRPAWQLTDYSKAVKLQQKALKPVTNTGKWGELLMNPNEQMSYSDYIEAVITYKLITGNAYTKATPLGAGANASVPDSLQVPPAQHVSIDAVDSFPATINSYILSNWSVKWSPEEVLHEKFFNPEWGHSGSHLYGQAPLKAALRRLKKNNSLTDSEAAMYENRGISGILHMKAQPGQVEADDLLGEVSRLKETMINEWTGSANTGRIGLGAYDMGWLPVGLTNQEMEMIASNIQDLRFICNVFGGLPSQLLNDPENKTFNNQKEGEKALTSRCVLPHLCAHKDAFNRKAKKDWGFKPNWVYDFDMTVYSELSSDAKDVAEWSSKIIAISPNEQRELAGLAALPDPQMSEPWVMSMGRMPLSDYSMNQVDQALNDAQTNLQGQAGN
jgi:phage portal protein BeeE